uniref:Uncharacterized protein n=1 Tax=Anguilla anguilla TaxID=7936 RepID=A0A0E9UNI7_ANGAN
MNYKRLMFTLYLLCNIANSCITRGNTIRWLTELKTEVNQ